MRIAVFCNDFWPVIGGVPTATRGLAGALRARGHEIVVLTRRPPDCAAEELVDGLPVRRFDWNVRPAPGFPLRFVRARAAVRRLIDDWRPDAVYAHFVSIHAVYAADVARRAGAPLILSFRGNDAMRIAPRSILSRAVYGRLTARAGASLFCSEWLRGATAAAAWFRGPPARTGVLMDAVAVQPREAAAEPARPYALTGGRFVHKKGFDILLHAWALIDAPSRPDLWIAGDGPEGGALRRLASTLGLGDRVRFLDAVSHPRLLGLLERASLCLVPSREEPYGIFVVEAQALGVPVVATAVGNIPNLVEHRRTGYLAPAEAEGMARVIREAWSDPERAAIGAAGRQAPGAVRDYDTMAAELEERLRLLGAGAGAS